MVHSYLTISSEIARFVEFFRQVPSLDQINANVLHQWEQSLAIKPAVLTTDLTLVPIYELVPDGDEERRLTIRLVEISSRFCSHLVLVLVAAVLSQVFPNLSKIVPCSLLGCLHIHVQYMQHFASTC